MHFFGDLDLRGSNVSPAAVWLPGKLGGTQTSSNIKAVFRVVVSGESINLQMHQRES